MNNLPAPRPVHALVNRSASSIRTSSGETFRAEIHRYGDDFILLFASNMQLYGIDRGSRYPPQEIRRESFADACGRMMPIMRHLYACEPKRDRILQALAGPTANGTQDAIILPR